MRERQKGENKKWHEKVEKQRKKAQSAIASEIPQGKGTWVWGIRCQGTKEGRNDLMNRKFILRIKRNHMWKGLKYKNNVGKITTTKHRSKANPKEKGCLFFKLLNITFRKQDIMICEEEGGEG